MQETVKEMELDVTAGPQDTAVKEPAVEPAVEQAVEQMWELITEPHKYTNECKFYTFRV